jgi:hypothetical protein
MLQSTIPEFAALDGSVAPLIGLSPQRLSDGLLAKAAELYTCCSPKIGGEEAMPPMAGTGSPIYNNQPRHPVLWPDWWFKA